MADARQLLLGRILREAAWAPIVVLALHQIVLRTPYRSALDHTIHFLGGAAVAYFFFRAIRIGDRFLDIRRSLTHYLLAFALACTTALAWEITEFASDQLRGTRIQQSIPETMGDLVAGMAGAAWALGVAFLWQPRRRWYR